MNQNKKVDLKLDWCSYEAAKYAVMNWHYSKTMPVGKLVRIGVWENERYIGAVIYGRGANNNMCKYLKCKMTECAELVRVALDKHITPVSKIISISIAMLKKKDMGLKILFSYADETNQNHKGIIYKASNWIYHSERIASSGAHWLLNGKLIHNRSMSSRYGSRLNFPKEAQPAPEQKKHLYIYNLRQ